MFYLLVVQNESTPAIYAYNSHDAALAAFHTEMAYRHEDRHSTKCMILNSNLGTLETEIYVAQPVDTTPTEEPTEGEQ